MWTVAEFLAAMALPNRTGPGFKAPRLGTHTVWIRSDDAAEFGSIGREIIDLSTEWRSKSRDLATLKQNAQSVSTPLTRH